MKQTLGGMFWYVLSLKKFSLLLKKKSRVFKYLDISGKPNFEESVTFQWKMFGVTNVAGL